MPVSKVTDMCVGRCGNWDSVREEFSPFGLTVCVCSSLDVNVHAEMRVIAEAALTLVVHTVPLCLQNVCYSYLRPGTMLESNL